MTSVVVHPALGFGRSRVLVSLMPGCTQSVGVPKSDAPRDRRWGFVLKVVNLSESAAVIEKIDVWWKGSRGFRAHNSPHMMFLERGICVKPSAGVDNIFPFLIDKNESVPVSVKLDMNFGRARFFRIGISKARYSQEEFNAIRNFRFLIRVTTNYGTTRIKVSTRRKWWKSI